MSVQATSAVWARNIKPPACLLVALAFADHADAEGGNVRPGVARISTKTGVTVRQVKRHISALRDMGVLVVEKPSTQHMPTVYRIPLRGDTHATPDDARGDAEGKPGVTPTVTRGDTHATRTQEPPSEPKEEARARPPARPDDVRGSDDDHDRDAVAGVANDSTAGPDERAPRRPPARRRGVDQSIAPTGLSTELVERLPAVLAVLRDVWQVRGGREPQERGVGLGMLRHPRADHLAVARRVQQWSTAGAGLHRPCRDFAARFGDWTEDAPAASAPPSPSATPPPQGSGPGGRETASDLIRSINAAQAERERSPSLRAIEGGAA
jgi:hypothetical protein